MKQSFASLLVGSLHIIPAVLYNVSGGGEASSSSPSGTFVSLS